MQWAMSFSNIQRISESTCFDLNPYILFKVYLGEKSCTWNENDNCQNCTFLQEHKLSLILFMQSSLILLRLLDMQVPNNFLFEKYWNRIQSYFTRF